MSVAAVSSLLHRAWRRKSVTRRPEAEKQPWRGKDVFTLAQDARVLAWALQANDVDEAELLKRANCAAKILTAPLTPGENGDSIDVTRHKRLCRALEKLTGERGTPFTAEDIDDIKGRLFKTPSVPLKWPARGFSKGEVFAELALQEALRVRKEGLGSDESFSNSLDSAQATAAVVSKAKMFLDHRRGYVLCLMHILFMALLVAILCIHLAVEPMFDARKVVESQLVPEEVLGQETWESLSHSLQGVEEIADWLEVILLSPTTGIFLDPVCGNEICDTPLEYPTWRASGHELGCESDCGSWFPDDEATQEHTVEIMLYMNTALLPPGTEDYGRWNLYCPQVSIFSEQIAYFEEDQNISTLPPSFVLHDGTSTVVTLFDCDWQLRVYAPMGGVSGALLFDSGGAVSLSTSAVQEASATNGSVPQSSSSFSLTNIGAETLFQFRGCEARQTDPIANLSLCATNVESNGLFNRSAFWNETLVDIIDEAAMSMLFLSFVQNGLTSGVPAETLDEYRAATNVLAYDFSGIGGDSAAVRSAECVIFAVSAFSESTLVRQWLKDAANVLFQSQQTTTTTASPAPSPSGASSSQEDAGILLQLTVGNLFNWANNVGVTDMWMSDQSVSSTPTPSPAPSGIDVFDSLFEVGREIDAEILAAIPLGDLTCDVAEKCSRFLLANGICDPECAVPECKWDVGDCCEPTFQSREAPYSSLATQASGISPFATLRVNSEGTSGSDDTDQTPYDAILDSEAAVPRYLGNAYRIIGGVLVEQQRHKRTACTDNKTRNHLTEAVSIPRDRFCLTEELQTEPFGVDPTFQPESSLYNEGADVNECHPDLEAGANPSAFPFVRFPSDTSSTFCGRADAVIRMTQEAAEPGFFDVDSFGNESDIDGSYPFFFDNNFEQARAQKYFDYMIDGHYLDEEVEEVQVSFLLYHEELLQFVRTTVTFTVETYGTVTMNRIVHVFPPGYYESLDTIVMYAAMVLEILYILIALTTLVLEIRKAVVLRRTTGESCAYFRSVWSFLNVLVILAQLAQICLWTEQIFSLQEGAFDPQLRYFVNSPSESCPNANLAQFNHSELTKLRIMLDGASHLDSTSYLFYTATAVVLAGMALQFMRLLHFQPRLSLISRTLIAAMADLIHWTLLFIGVECFLALCLHIVCGSVIASASTYEQTVQTLMLCLFGDTEVAHDLGEKFPIVGYIFYYIHMIASFLLLLNMLLAIIVEAYIHVKQEASAADNVFVDMYKQAKAGLRATQRPKDILSITAVIEKTAHWLRPDPPQPAGAGNPSIELEGEFKATEEDLQRVLRAYLVHEAVKQKLSASVRKERTRSFNRDSTTENATEIASRVCAENEDFRDLSRLDAEVTSVTRSLLYHYADNYDYKAQSRISPRNRPRSIYAVSHDQNHNTEEKKSPEAANVSQAASPTTRTRELSSRKSFRTDRHKTYKRPVERRQKVHDKTSSPSTTTTASSNPTTDGIEMKELNADRFV